MLLCVGDPDDLTAVYVGWLAGQRGLGCIPLPEADYGVSWWLNADDEAGRLELIKEEKVLSLDRLTGVFVRFNPEPPLPEEWSLSTPARELFLQERRVAISELIERLPVPLVNRPSAGRSNGTKPAHMALLAKRGLRIPNWIATNDADAAIRFLDACPDGAVVKSASGLRCHVRLADDEYLARLRDGTTSSVLQRFIAGGEVRVHVVGEAVFGAHIDSPDVDYRFSNSDVGYRRAEVPFDVAVACVGAAAADQLILAGFDFRVDAEGRWWCLEMNPVPTFLPYEASSGCAIGDAILDVMQGRSRPTRAHSLLAALVQPPPPRGSTGTNSPIGSAGTR